MHHPKPNIKLLTHASLAAALAASAALLAGCETPYVGSDTDEKAPIKPEDFVGEPRNGEPETPDPRVAETDSADEPDDTGQDRPATPRPDQALAVNAMVGHINGKAVYADNIFDVNVAAQLASFGQRYDGARFQSEALAVIKERLRGVIIDKLILGEAERFLKKEQRQAIDQRVVQEKEELVRFYGQGSISKAKAEFRKDREQELDEYLVQYREQLAIGFYMQSKVQPKIVVDQRAIERYYEDNKANYQKPDLRVIRIIRTPNPADAQQIARRLSKGEPFELIAADEAVNDYQPDDAGLFNDGEPLPGDYIYGIKPVNEALLPLDEGEYAGPILAGDNSYFVQVVSYEPGEKFDLADKQIEIEQVLRALQFEKHARRLRNDMLKRGSYTDPHEMGLKLLEIAYTRYDR